MQGRQGDCPLEGWKEEGHNINNKTELVLRWGEPMARDDAVFSGVQSSTFSPMILQGQSRRKKKQNKQKSEGKRIKQIIERIGRTSVSVVSVQTIECASTWSGLLYFFDFLKFIVLHLHGVRPKDTSIVLLPPTRLCNQRREEQEEKRKKDGVLSSHSCCTVGRGCLDTRAPVHPSVQEEKEKSGPWEDVPRTQQKIPPQKITMHA
ncbi:MAG: hypothetical protein BYD32DRAFT_425149 [Podila humilis]|nr:MAG: hypothetical protein BYD32DRAFT_425149 [Podila humilis]